MRRTSLGTAVLVLGFTFSTAALGTPEIQVQFTGVCKPKAGSKLATTQCTSCHVKMGEKPLNLFGTDVKAELARQKSKKFTAAVWKKVAARDSDRDRVKNGAEVVAGTLPADPKSKP
jgi:hypothetical protein